MFLCLGALLLVAACGGDDDNAPPIDSGPIEALVFSHTRGFRHPSIADAVAFFSSLSPEEEINVTLTEDPTVFNDTDLAAFDVVVFANTTGDVFDEEQQSALQRFIRGGKGYVGVHSAADTEHQWPWYGQLVGAYFISHPLLPVEVEVTTEDPHHPSTQHLPDTFAFTDEIYNFDRNPRSDHAILLTIDEAGFIFPNIPNTPSMGADHPVAWYKEFEGGRSFYTNLGHRPETWDDPLFQQHILEGLRWAAAPINYNRIILTTVPRNPMELAVANDGRVLFIERTGELRVWRPDTGEVIEAGALPVDTTSENGLLGLALDPAFDRNGRLYLYHSSPIGDPHPDGPPGRNVLSAFRLNRDDTLDLTSREDLLELPSERQCCHEGGSLAFAPDGTLFLSVGDNTNPFPAMGWAPLDERPGQETENSQRTAQNPFDPRGSILRIRPDGSIPDGNMFPPDGSQGRPEIYIMGNRNPFRIAVDPDTGRLFWGEVGPDAVADGPRGPRGYDEINFADAPGNYGWPHCIGPNLPYSRYDFASGEVGAPYSCEAFEPSLLAYDYLTVSELVLGNALASEAASGFTGRTAIAGVFYRAPTDRAPFQLPTPFRDRLLMTEWTRDIIAAVDIDDDGGLRSLTRLLPWERFRRPMDLAVGPDGALYVLEFGTSFFGDNPDAQLTRIEYSPTGELSPVAQASASVTAGPPPLTVVFSAAGSRAPGRGDSIRAIEWDFDGDGRVDSRDADPSFTYEQPGRYSATLTVVGVSGRRSYPAATEIVVGNTPPQVRILAPQDGETVELNALVELRGEASDVEDGAIACDDLLWDVRLGHNAHSHPLFSLRGCETQFRAFLGGHDEQGTLFFAVELTYTDEGGAGGEPSLTGRDGIRINVR
jgi:glucose/arabinose dehydrogenase